MPENMETVLVQQNKSFFDWVQELNPVPDYFSEDQLQALATSDNPVETAQNISQSWMQGASYIYDAVMTIGIGACQAVVDNGLKNGSGITGAMHLDGIRSVDFMGASGRVAFRKNSTAPGSRIRETVPFCAVNLLPFGG